MTICDLCEAKGDWMERNRITLEEQGCDRPPHFQFSLDLCGKCRKQIIAALKRMLEPPPKAQPTKRSLTNNGHADQSQAQEAPAD